MKPRPITILLLTVLVLVGRCVYGQNVKSSEVFPDRASFKYTIDTTKSFPIFGSWYFVGFKYGYDSLFIRGCENCTL